MQGFAVDDYIKVEPQYSRRSCVLQSLVSHSHSLFLPFFLYLRPTRNVPPSRVVLQKYITYTYCNRGNVINCTCLLIIDTARVGTYNNRLTCTCIFFNSAIDEYARECTTNYVMMLYFSIRIACSALEEDRINNKT